MRASHSTRGSPRTLSRCRSRKSGLDFDDRVARWGSAGGVECREQIGRQAAAAGAELDDFSPRRGGEDRGDIDGQRLRRRAASSPGAVTKSPPGAELARAGRVVAEAGRVQRDLHVVAKRQESAARARCADRSPRTTRPECTRASASGSGRAGPDRSRAHRARRTTAAATAGVDLLVYTIDVIHAQSNGSAERERAGQGRADHRRREAGRRRDLPAPACGRREPDAPLPRLRRRGAPAAGRAERRARGLGGADPGRPARPRQARRRSSSRPSMRFGRLDALVNNASSFFPTPVGEIRPAHWDDLIGTNVRAPLFLAQAAAAAAEEDAGRDRQHHRHPRRAAAAQLRRLLGREGGAHRAHALARARARARRPRQRVAPGPILWPDDESSSTSSSRQRIISHTPLRREGTPDDIAQRRAFPARGRAATSPARRSTSTAAVTSRI